MQRFTSFESFRRSCCTHGEFTQGTFDYLRTRSFVLVRRSRVILYRLRFYVFQEIIRHWSILYRSLHTVRLGVSKIGECAEAHVDNTARQRSLAIAPILSAPFTVEYLTSSDNRSCVRMAPVSVASFAVRSAGGPALHRNRCMCHRSYRQQTSARQALDQV